MKILFITTESILSNTSSNIRNVSLIKGFLEIGHNVEILTAIDAKKRSTAEFEEIISACKIHNIKVGSLRTFFSSPNSAEKKKSKLNIVKAWVKKNALHIYNKFRIYDILKSVVSDFNKENFQLSKYDLVISSSDPKSSHLLAEMAIQKYNIYAPWVQYWGDPMYHDTTNDSFFTFLMKREENRLLKKANFIMYTNPLTAEALKKLYPAYKEKMDWVPTSYYKVKNEAEVSLKQEKERLTIGYFGDYLTKWRNILPLYNAAEKMRYNLIIAGSGDARISNTEIVRIYPRLSLSEVEKMQESVNLLVCISNKARHDEHGIDICTQVPGKVYHYALTHKPILMIYENEKLEKNFKIYNRYHFSKNEESEIIKVLKSIVEDSSCVSNTPVEEFTPASVGKIFIIKVFEKSPT